MNIYKRLISNTVVLGVGKFASKLIVLFMMPFYTLILSPEEFGTADLVSQTANIIIPLACIGVCDGLFRFALDCEDKKKVFTTSITALTAGSVVMAIALPILTFFEVFEGYVWLIGAYVICANFHSACAQYIRAQGKTVLFAAQGILNTVLTVVLNILFLWQFKWGALGYVLSVVIADLSVTVLIVICAKLYRDFTPEKFSKETLSELLKFSIPYIPTTMLWLITSVSDRYIVKLFCGIEETGLYAAAYKIPTLLTLACGVFIEAWQFSVVKDVEGEERAKFFEKVYYAYLSFIFIVSSILIAATQIFTRILLAESYFVSWEYVPVLIAATLFSTLVSFMGSIYFAEKKSVLSMLTSLMGAIINVALNFILIPDHGAMGAAVATFISYLAVYVIRAYNTKRYVRFNLHSVKLVLNTILLFIEMALLYSGVRYSKLACVGVMILIILFNIKGIIGFLRRFLNSIKKKSEKKS